MIYHQKNIYQKSKEGEESPLSFIGAFLISLTEQKCLRTCDLRRRTL